MDDDLDLRKFDNRCRLFPLPNLVFFPHNVLPLHIFEPRYRQMTEDALATDQLITMVRLLPETGRAPADPDRPAIDLIGCLGKIIRHERTEDGRFYFLLVGKKRVRLTREIPSEKLYRIAEADILEDEPVVEPEGPTRDELIRLFRGAFERFGPLDPDLAGLLTNVVPLGILTDILTNAMNLPSDLKQGLLEERSALRRAETLLAVLRQLPTSENGPSGGGRTFPPPFSMN